MTYMEVGPEGTFPTVTEDQLRRLGDILAAVDARLERERLARLAGPASSAGAA